MSITKLRSPLKTHGGKHYLKDFVISHFPKGYENMMYCEPFCGGANVLLNKIQSEEEIISDLDTGTVSVFKALRDEPKEFVTKLKRLNYTERTFKLAQGRLEKEFDDYIDHAISEFIVRRMSRGGLKKTFAWSDRERGGQPGDVNAWETIIDELPSIAARLKGVTILNKDFRDVVKVWDEDNTLTYLDPPYLPATRSEGSQDLYEHELSVEDHVQMLNFAKNARGKIIISGYVSQLYNRTLKGWKCYKKEMPNHSSQAKEKEKRIECVWVNY